MCRVYLEAEGGWAGEWGRRAWAVGDFFFNLFIFCVCGWVGDHMLSPACSCHVSGPQNFNTFWQCVSWALPLVVHEGVTTLLCLCMCMYGRTQHNTIVFLHSSSLATPSSYSHLVLSVHCAKFTGSHITAYTHIKHNCTQNASMSTQYNTKKD